MKKIIVLLSICMFLSAFTYAQQKPAVKTIPKLTKKEATKILESAWNDVKTSDTANFIKLWSLDDTQWPYHAGSKFTRKDVYDNYLDFRSYFDTAMVKKLKFSGVECDTVEHSDPHYDYAKYYIKASFKYSNTHTGGFGFYMDYINKQWFVRFSPDYFDFGK
jgi:hypothetical protein